MGVPVREEKGREEKWADRLFEEIMSENFSILRKYMNI